jgi:predicted kinase
MEKNKVIIMRGISGAGKSTYIKKHFPSAVICSADQYFIDANSGNYNFDASKLRQAHNACKEKFKEALKNQEPLIVVDNTNTQLWEFQPYVQLAQTFGYDVEVIRLKVNPMLASKRNKHKVPIEAINKMEKRFVDYPEEKIIDTNA